MLGPKSRLGGEIDVKYSAPLEPVQSPKPQDIQAVCTVWDQLTISNTGSKHSKCDGLTGTVPFKPVWQSDLVQKSGWKR